VIGAVIFRQLGWKSAVQSFVHAATRSGLVLFIVAAAQSLAFILTLQQVPHMVGDMMLALSKTDGVWLFMLLSIAVLTVMGSVLEGAAALIISGRCCCQLLSNSVSIACIRRGDGHRDGHRAVRAAAGPRPLRRLLDRQCADRADRETDPRLSRAVIFVPAGGGLRPKHQYILAARLRILS
jgi:hypothetical protein